MSQTCDLVELSLLHILFIEHLLKISLPLCYLSERGRLIYIRWPLFQLLSCRVSLYFLDPEREEALPLRLTLHRLLLHLDLTGQLVGQCTGRHRLWKRDLLVPLLLALHSPTLGSHCIVSS